MFKFIRIPQFCKKMPKIPMQKNIKEKSNLPLASTRGDVRTAKARAVSCSPKVKIRWAGAKNTRGHGR